MTPSEKLIEHIKKSEGCRLTAYKDSANVWTIGYGHTKGVKMGDTITTLKADALLREDLKAFESDMSKIRGLKTQGQYDAVFDFVYNLGYSKFKTSTLASYIACGRKTYEIQQQFLKWVNAGGKFAGGLYTRRIWEAQRWTE